jgi:hypothetical protein
MYKAQRKDGKRRCMSHSAAAICEAGPGWPPVLFCAKQAPCRARSAGTGPHQRVHICWPDVQRSNICGQQHATCPCTSLGIHHAPQLPPPQQRLPANNPHCWSCDCCQCACQPCIPIRYCREMATLLHKPRSSCTGLYPPCHANPAFLSNGLIKWSRRW